MTEQQPSSTQPIRRRLNLLRLLRDYTEEMVGKGVMAKGIEQRFAEHLEISPATLSQLKGSRAMGNKLAAQIEKSMKKPPGWIDEDHGSDIVTSTEARFIELARAAWASSNAAGRRTLMRLAKEGFKSTREQ